MQSERKRSASSFSSLNRMSKEALIGHVVDQSLESGKMNTVQFCVNLMKGIAGTGVLALPYAFDMVGIIPGILLFTVVCVMMILATYQLVQVHEDRKSFASEHGKSEVKTSNMYAEMVYYVMNRQWYRVFLTVSVVTIIGSSIGSMVAMADFAEAVPGVGKARRWLGQVVVTVICIALSLLKDPTMLVWISSFGLFAIVGAFACLLVLGVMHMNDPVTPSPAAISESILSLGKTSELWWESFPQFLRNFGIFCYCMGYILFFLTQYKHLRSESKPRILRSTGITISLMAVIYSAVGISILLLYKKFGIKGNIMKNLPEGQAITVIVNLLMCFTVIGGFPLWLEPMNEMVETFGGERTVGKYFISNPKYIGLRIVEVCIISVIAYMIPNFADILAVIGNFTDVLTTFSFPAVMHIMVFKSRMSLGMKIADYVSLGFSLTIMVVCTSVSIIFFGK